MLRKLLITPWFGPLPPWFDRWHANYESALAPLGYDLLLTTNLSRFKQRVGDLLHIICPIEPGTGKVHDYRPALGLLFEDELRQGQYDYWGHTDFDCVYGRVDFFMDDWQILKYDIWSNHHNYICGPWTLYANRPKINRMFQAYPTWDSELRAQSTTGWAETLFTRVVDNAHDRILISRLYTHYQGKNPHDTSQLSLRPNGALMDGGDEIMMFHFRHVKEWPGQIKFD